MSAPPPNPAAVSKAKARTAASIPAMRASGVLREPSVNPLLPAGTATPVSSSVRSDKLEEEARKMEDRLHHLKAAMMTEKQKRDTLPKTKAGTYWKSANPTQNDKKYMEEVLARVEKRIAKSNAVGAAGAGAAGAAGSAATPASGSQSTRVPAAAAGSAGAKPAVQRTASANVSKSSSGSSGSAAAVDITKSSYAPPIQPKNPISVPSAVRAQGTEQLAATLKAIPAVVASAPGQQQASARSAVSPAVSSRRPAAASSSAAPSASAAGEFINPADDDSRPTAPGSLLDGDFDEAANKAAFEEARQQWIAESSGAATGGGGAAAQTKPRVQLVHDPDFSPAQLASSGSGGSAKDSLLNGPAFNERESAREFQEARKAWMQSLDSNAAGAGAAPKAALKPQPQSASADADGMWNPSIALGSGGSILFPTGSGDSGDASRPQTGAATVSSALRSSQSSLEKSAKSSCYGCYKLFYTSAALTDVDFAGKSFCSQACIDLFAATNKLRCLGEACPRSVLQSEGTRFGPQGKFMCKSCAQNGGRAVIVTAPAAPSAAAAVTASSSSLPAVSSSPDADAEQDDADPAAAADDADPEAEADQEEEEEEEEEEDADGGVPEASSPEQNAFNIKARRSAGVAANAAAAAAALPVAPTSSPALPAAALSRPTTASSRPVLDTSVILKAPAGSAAPVVDFPSDDDE